MENLAILGSFATHVHEDFRNIFYLIMPVFFGLSLAMVWIQGASAGPEFIGALKRVLIANLLLAGFPEITDAVLSITQGISEKISNMDGLDNYLRMAGERAKAIPLSPYTFLLAFDDLVIATLTYLSFLVVLVLRNLMMAIYHFIWILLVILAPILLLFNAFSAKITMNLFKSLCEVACWPIVWSVQSAMLTSMAFGEPMKADSGYLTLILMNFIVAAGIFCTPLIVRGLLGASFAAAATSIGAIGAAAMLKTPQRLMQAAQVGRGFLSDMSNLISPPARPNYDLGRQTALLAPPASAIAPDTSRALATRSNGVEAGYDLDPPDGVRMRVRVPRRIESTQNNSPAPSPRPVLLLGSGQPRLGPGT